MLEYTSAGPCPGRRSKLAIVSLLLPIAGLPLSIVITKALADVAPRVYADRLGMLAWVTTSALGLGTALTAIRRIHRSGGILRGRPVAIVGIAFSITFIAWAIIVLFAASEL